MTARVRSFLFVAVSMGFVSSLSLLGGAGLEIVGSKIIPLIPLLIAIPGLNDLVGDYGSIIAAHTGDAKERKKTHRELARSILKIIFVNILGIIILSLATATQRGYVLEGAFAIKFAAFVTVSVLATVGFMFALNKSLDRLLLKEKYNPDDFLIPVSTAIADVLMLLLVTLAVVFIF